MCSPQTILDKVVEKIVDAVIQSVVRHVRFVTRYKENLENLDAEKKILEDQQITINEKVRNAETLGEDIITDVTNWLTEANKMRQEVEDFINPKTVKENMQCFAISCPDYISRYQLSKQIEKKIGDVKNLTQKANFDKVSDPKSPPPELQFRSRVDSVSLDYTTFDSRESVFKRIMDALRDSEVYKIGVYGIGGVGKTTMVKEVGKQVKKYGLFDEVVMAVVSQPANVSQIQLQLIGDLNPKPSDVEKATDEHERAKKLWPRLNNGKKNLIILDDIWNELNLHEIGIPITDENKGCCKVVITTRNRDVWKNMHIDKEILIPILSQPEAWDLFKKKVGNSIDSDQELHDTAVKVCKECQGLPVAILAVGAALKDKKKYVWKDALDKLKDSMLKNIAGIDPKVYVSLKFSYDWLESIDAKSCFLLCCFFPEDAKISIETLARHCIARRLLEQNPYTLRKARNRVHAMVDILKDACLLLEGIDENIVKMHDVIRDVALSIAKDDNQAIMVKHGVQKWPERDMCESYSMISITSENIHELPNDLVCPQLHTLALQLGQPINPRLNVQDRFFSGMEKLTILELNSIHMLRLPSSLANLVNLRMLYLIYCKLEGITILKDLKNNLEILSLRGSDIEVLPSEIGQLTHLRLLDLGNCKQLREIPQGVLSNLSCLEELYMLNGFDQWEATTSNKERSNVSLVELSKFTQLTTLEIQVPNLMLLPKDLCFENLKRFKISMGVSFKMNEDYSRIFKFKGVSLRDEFNVLLERAEVLDLNNLEGLRKMHHDRAGEGFLFQSYRLDTSRSFNKLTKLTIQGCKLKYLFTPSCTRVLLQLQELNVQNCEIMEEIVGIEGEKDKEELTSQVINFSQLKRMKLEGLPKLISFYPKMKKATTSDGNSSTQSLFNEKVDFPLLDDLWIDKLPNITEIWDKQLLIVPQKESNSFCQLQWMIVCDCENMMNVVRSNDDFITFPQLKHLYLSDLKNLKSFYNWTTRSETQPLFNHQVDFPLLKDLKIDMLPNITEIWDKQLLTVPQKESNSFCQLHSIKVWNCENMMNVVRSNDDIITFSQLKSLELWNLMKLKSFCSWTTRSETQSLFNHQVVFPALESLEIDNVPTITEVLDRDFLLVKERELKSFCQLTFMEVSNCEKMVNVVPSNMVPQLQNLKKLQVSKCPKMEAIVLEKTKEKKATNDDIILFPQLTALSLDSLINLKSFYSSPTRSEAQQPLFNHQVDFPLLEYLKINMLPNITEIWDKQLLTVPQKDVAFPKLKELHLLNCVNLGEIHLWNVLVSEISLKVLRVEKCDQESTVVSLRLVQRLQYLDKLIVRNCGGVTEVFQLEGLNVGEREVQHQHGRPLTEVRMMELDSLPQLTCLWNKDPRGILSLQSLQYLVIKKCSFLRNLLTCSTAMALQQLKVLYLESCTLMEQVIATDEGGHKEEATDDDDDDEIEFSKLEWLILKDLPNLNSFCNMENCNFNFPSLKRVVLKRCPKMQTFTSGQVRMSQVLVSTRGNEGIQTEDLNKYLTEQPLLKGEESATMDENDYEENDYPEGEGEEDDYSEGEGEENDYSNLLWLRE